MKKFNEQERYYARKNRQMDLHEAINSACVYTDKAASEFTKREGVTLGTDISEEVIDETRSSLAWVSDALVSMKISFGDLKEIIQRAYQSGVDKGREQGGLKPLFGEEV
ncbi:TPA: hypothetical protein N3A33_005226 [Salmonella enterica subsp. salamae serovar 28:r:e,n,z15]|nr:hypothetical protein [Salmonella enterica subsp. salamae serovar 28:r:e,n,z15]